MRGGLAAGDLGRFAAWALVGTVAAIGLAVALDGPDPRVLAVDPADQFAPETVEAGRVYADLKLAFWGAGTLLRWGALAGLAVGGGGHVLARAGRAIGRGRSAPAAFATAVLALGLVAIALLPIAYASGHAVERAFGLSTQSRLGWALDWLRATGFWTLVYGAAAAGFLACLARWPRRGWLVAAGGGVLVAVAGTFLAPLAIDPVFHDFAPLADAELEAEIVDLGAAAGLDVGRVRVMDASRRTRRLNAYVTGLGATRQVVLYDNLVERAPREELLLVVAHEIGHAAGHHVRTGLLWALPAIVAGAWGLAQLAGWQARRDPALAEPADPAGLPLLLLAVSLALFLSSPVASAIGRGLEADADWSALELTADPDTFVRVRERVARTNLALVDPPGWLVAWAYSHPPVLERIGMAEAWRRGRPPTLRAHRPPAASRRPPGRTSRARHGPGSRPPGRTSRGRPIRPRRGRRPRPGR